MLGESIEDFVIKEDENGNPLDQPIINWQSKINFKDNEVVEALKEFYLPSNERFYNKKEVDIP